MVQKCLAAVWLKSQKRTQDLNTLDESHSAKTIVPLEQSTNSYYEISN